jgi:hypothetical protein
MLENNIYMREAMSQSPLRTSLSSPPVIFSKISTFVWRVQRWRLVIIPTSFSNTVPPNALPNLVLKKVPLKLQIKASSCHTGIAAFSIIQSRCV